MEHAPESQAPTENSRTARSLYGPMDGISPAIEQAIIGRSLVIKGEISGVEALFIDGRVEGTINVPENRVTIGRMGSVLSDIRAREVVVMGTVKGNLSCSDRADIRNGCSVTGEVVAKRVTIEDGAMIKGSVEVRAAVEVSETGSPTAEARASHQDETASVGKRRPLVVANQNATPVEGSSVLVSVK